MQFPCLITRNQVRGRLLCAGYSIASWSQLYGFHPVTVRSVIDRWAGAYGSPRGKARIILSKLEQTIDQPIYSRPGTAMSYLWDKRKWQRF